MSRPLGHVQARVLTVLASYPDAPPTAAEVAVRTVYNTSSAWKALKALATRGLVERAGVAHGGARTWVITNAGRAALAEGLS